MRDVIAEKAHFYPASPPNRAVKRNRGDRYQADSEAHARALVTCRLAIFAVPNHQVIGQAPNRQVIESAPVQKTPASKKKSGLFRKGGK